MPYEYIGAILLAIAAIAGGYGLRSLLGKKQVLSAEAKAREILAEARAKEKEALLQAKDKAIAIIDDAKKEEVVRRQEINSLQQRLENRENLFDKKLLEIESKEEQLRGKDAKVEQIRADVEKMKEQGVAMLEKLSGYNRDEARTHLLDTIEVRMKDELLQRFHKLQKEGNESLEREAREILSTVISRCASSHVVETTTTTVSLPSDEMKGRIIGREGRNIKALEQLTGVEIVVDDTPETIVITGFSGIRRHLAKRTLEKLIADGRIHPTRIEEAVEEAKRDLALDIKKAGEEATFESGVAGLDPKLVQILGRLKYRTSYGQHVLQHSIEVSFLSVMLAEELGANTVVARKGGLLHDIGKAVDHEVQGTHPQIGYEIMKKFGLPEEIAYISIGHHEDPPKSLEALIVKVADAISGARPGARKDTYENYLHRLEELEQVANSFEGVEKTYAMQAGREVRVFVVPEKIDDYSAMKLARDIASKIETELKYPGEIRVNVIRENRYTEYAR